MTRQATPNAFELGLRRPVASIHARAGGAGPTRVTRINSHQPKFGIGALVREEHAQLVEGPGRQCRSLCLANRDPGSDVGQFFDRNSAPGAFGSSDDFFTDAVIQMPLKARLPSAAFSEQAPCSSGSLCLKPPAQTKVALAQSTDLAAGIESSVTVGRDVPDPHVYAQEVRGLGRGRRRGASREDEAEPVFDPIVRESSLPQRSTAQPIALVTTDLQRDGDPSGEGRARYTGYPQQSENAAVIGNRSEGLEGDPRFLAACVGLDDFADGAHGKLRRQTKLVPDSSICQVVKGNLTERLGFPCCSGHNIAGRVEGAHCFCKSLGLLRGRVCKTGDGSGIHHPSIANRLKGNSNVFLR